LTAPAEHQALQADADRKASNRHAIAHDVLQVVEGQTAASHLLYDLAHTTPHPDALHDALQAVLIRREPERLRGFCRALQKRLESAR
jgi:hypothetical protein